MWVEVVKIVLASAGALVVAWSVFTFKEGGRRRMRRREIVEELELIKLLDDRPTDASLVQAHVDELLHQYVSPARSTWRRTALMTGTRVVLSVGMAAVVISVPMPWWGLTLMVVAVGISGAAVEVWLERLWERRDAQREQGTMPAPAP